MKYATITGLVHRFGGAEIVARGWPDDIYGYLGESASSAALATDWPAAVADDVALVTADPAIYRYDGNAWAALAAARVDGKLTDAEAEIDGYLAGRFTLPLAKVPQVLERLACDLARYYLFDDQAPETVEQRYKDALKMLRSVGKGDLNLGLDANQESVPSGGGPDFTAPDPVFSGGATTLNDF